MTDLAVLEDDTRVAVMMPSAAGALNKSEVEAQLDAAHKHPRFDRKGGIHGFLNEATTLATFSQEIASSRLWAPFGRPNPSERTTNRPSEPGVGAQPNSVPIARR